MQNLTQAVILLQKMFFEIVRDLREDHLHYYFQKRTAVDTLFTIRAAYLSHFETTFSRLYSILYVLRIFI